MRRALLRYTQSHAAFGTYSTSLYAIALSPRLLSHLLITEVNTLPSANLVSPKPITIFCGSSDTKCPNLSSTTVFSPAVNATSPNSRSSGDVLFLSYVTSIHVVGFFNTPLSYSATPEASPIYTPIEAVTVT
jgi:hypothetical protein